MCRTVYIGSLLLLVSCSSPDISSIHTFRTYEENGITIAESNDVPKFQGDLFRYEKVVEIRSDTTNQDAILYRPFGYDIDKDGLIYVADSGNHRIAVFNMEGEYLRSIGREGDGPGEFRSPMSVQIVEDKLQIPEASKQQTTIYNRDGTLDEVVTYRHARSGSSVGRATIAPNGNHIIQRIIQDRGERFSSRSHGFCITTPQGDTLAIIETPMIRTMERQDRGFTNIRFARAPSAYPELNRGIYLTTGLPPEIDWFNFEGQLIRRIRLVFEEQLVTSEDIEEVRAYYNKQIADYDQRVRGEFSEPFSKEFLERQRDTAKYSDVKAHWAGIRVDNYGFIWLNKHELLGTSSYEAHIHEFYVLSPEGEFLGLTSTPKVDFVSIGMGYLKAVVTDSRTGEMVPTLFRITPAVAGLEYP